MDHLEAYFSALGFASSDLIDILQSFRKKTFGKGEHFLEENKISRHLAFIEKGLFQFYVLKDGEERTVYFTAGNNFLTS